MSLPWLIEAMGRIAGGAFTSMSAPIQYAAISATHDTPSLNQYLLACQQILGELSRQATERLNEVLVKVCKVVGAFTCLSLWKLIVQNWQLEK